MIELDNSRAMQIVFRDDFNGHELTWTVANSGVSSRDLIAMDYRVERYIPRTPAREPVSPVRNERREWAKSLNQMAFLPDGGVYPI